MLPALPLALLLSPPQTPLGELPFLAVGETVAGETGERSSRVDTPTLRVLNPEQPVVGERFVLEVEETGLHTLELRSHFFDAYLVLRDESGALLAEDDDSAAGVNARIVRRLEPGVAYLVDACAVHGERGLFELALARGSPPALSLAEEQALERAELERSVAAREEVLGPKHPWTARALYNLANLHSSLGEYGAARSLHERALAIREEALGSDHPDTVWSLTCLAVLFQEHGDYASARPLYERALAISERTAPASVQTAKTLSGLGGLLVIQGDYAAARQLLQRTLALFEELLGPADPETGTALNNLGTLLYAQGDYDAARPALERALAIREKTLGPAHPETATSQNNLGLVLLSIGEYAAARRLLERALAIRAGIGPDRHETAGSLNNLASLLRSQGDLAAAQALHERALAIYEKTLGPTHPETATVLNNVGDLLWEQGKLDSARPFLERALAIRERTLGPAHPETAASLSSLARLLRSQDDAAAARALYERAVAIREEALGADHPETGSSLVSLAFLSSQEGDYSGAQPLLERALASVEKSFGSDHPSTAVIRYGLANVLADLGRAPLARDRARSAVESSMSHARNVLWSLSEPERLLFLEASGRNLQLLLSLCRSAPEGEQARAYELSLAWRGIASQAQLASRAQLRASVPAAAAAVLDELHGVQSMISKLLYATTIPDPARHEREMRDLRARRNELEVELARLTGPSEEHAPTLSALRGSLEPGSAFLDLVVQPLYEPARREGDSVVRKGSWTEDHLLAWIVRPERALVQLDLGPAHAVEVEVKRWLGTIASARGVAVGDGEKERGAHLRALLWEPLAEPLDGTRLVFVRPDSFLGTLPFGVVPLGEERFLLEEKGFVYVQTPADLLRMGGGAPAAAPTLLAVGGVDFKKRAGGSAAPSVAHGDQPRGNQTPFWSRLPHTEGEAQTVHDLAEAAFDAGKGLLLTGDAPTEERLKEELPRHSVLHLATHGFFHPAGTVSLKDSAREQLETEQALGLERETTALVGQLPGLLSGLVCAGANEPAPPGRDDGFLTAEEVLWLDLSGVDLVVLSACETALGERRAGEGMLGLCRAFGLAGAKTVVSSLWSVRDRSTSELMQGFYENLWLKKQPRAEALRNAQLALLAENRAVEHEPLPSTWGAFVLSGEWR